MRRFSFVLALLAVLVVTPQASAWSWPLRGEVLRPYSLGPDPYAAGQHRGVDVAGSAGDAVRAPAAGVVSFVGVVPSSGRTVTIQTDGYAVSLTHLGETTVAKGATVAEGDAVGVAGQSGEVEWPTPYVHLGIRVSSAADGYIDPATLLPPREVAPPPPPAGEVAAPAPSPAPVAAAGHEPCSGARDAAERWRCTEPSCRRGSRSRIRARRFARARDDRERHCSVDGCTEERDPGGWGRGTRRTPRRHAACRSDPAEPRRHGSAGWLDVHRGICRIARPSGRWLCRCCPYASHRGPGCERRCVRVGGCGDNRRVRLDRCRGPSRSDSACVAGRRAGWLACGSRSSRRCGNERASPAARS